MAPGGRLGLRPPGPGLSLGLVWFPADRRRGDNPAWAASIYFRVLNPATQGRRGDPEKEYACRWVPELAGLPASAIHGPWQASPAVPAAAGVVPGATYPAPIVDPAEARAAVIATDDAARRG